MNYTSIEQSKKLLELGLSPESADMFYNKLLDSDDWGVQVGSVPKLRASYVEYLPCWSVGALIALLPLGTTIHSHFTSVGVAYEIYTEKERFERLSLFEALYDIIEWLLKQGCIKQ